MTANLKRQGEIEAGANLPEEIWTGMLARAREAWKRGDRLFIIRQHEQSRLAFEECRCDRHQCGGCLTLAANMGRLEHMVPADALTDAQIEGAQAAARADWHSHRNHEATVRATIAERTRLYRQHDTAVGEDSGRES